MNFVRNVFILAVGVLLAALVVPGINFDQHWDALLLVALVLALFNAVIKPVLVLFALPFIIITLGVGLWFINALMLYWAARLVGGIEVTGALAALLGALVISVTNMLLSGPGIRARRARDTPHAKRPPKDGEGGGEVIDV